MQKLILFLSLLVSSIAWSQNMTPSDVSMKWLNEIDKDGYIESWQVSDPLFQSQITQEKWVQALQDVRAPLGNVISRIELSSTLLSTLPGVPVGEYTVLRYQTEFQNKKTSIETLTLSKSSGQWKAVGYFIK